MRDGDALEGRKQQAAVLGDRRFFAPLYEPEA
jgi:hypothetical protein